MKKKHYLGALFDLDGVIVDTAKYHYCAWKKLASSLGFDFTEAQNERLKGIGRMQSLEILLEIGGVVVTEVQKQELAEKKNTWYVEYLKNLDESELLPGATECLTELKTLGVKTALGSASKNAPMILDNLKIRNLFDAIIDGNVTTKAKPDPQVFLLGAQALSLAPEDCIVFEDASAGVEAAKSAGCFAIGIGNPINLPKADICIDGLHQLRTSNYFKNVY